MSSGQHKVLRLLTLVVILFGTFARPGTARAESPTLGVVATRLKEISTKLDSLGSLEELGEMIPLSNQSLTDALQLADLFKNSLKAKLDTIASFDAASELAQAIGDADTTVGGVPIAFSHYGDSNPASLPEVSETSHPGYVDVRFRVTATRTINVPFTLDKEALKLEDGSFAVHVSLVSDLNFRLDSATLDFFVVGEPALNLKATASGAITGFQTNLGFTKITVGGSATVNFGVRVQFQDPDGFLYGGVKRITIAEIQATALEDLFDIAVVDDPDTNAVDVALTLNSDLIDGSPDVSYAFTDDTLTDRGPANPTGLDTGTLNLSNLGDFTNIQPHEVLNGLGQLTSSLLAAQGLGDPQVPFTNKRLSDAMRFATDLLAFLRLQGDAAVICGTEDGTPPSGRAARNLKTGDTFYCQAISLQTPTQVEWKGTNATPDATNKTAIATVGVAPSKTVEFTMTADGDPKIEVEFTEPAPDSSPGPPVQKTAEPRFGSAQELFDKLAEKTGLTDSSRPLTYDSATHSLKYRLQKTIATVPGIAADVDFAEKLRSVNLAGLTPTASGGASVDISVKNITVDITFGVLLVDPVVVPAADVADRFFIEVPDEAGDPYELRADATASGTVDLQGTIGVLEVTATGDATASADGKVFEITSTDPDDPSVPLLGIQIDPGTGFEVGPVGNKVAVARGIQLTALLERPADYITASCNVALSSGIKVSAELSGLSQPISAGVDIAWPDAFKENCVPDPSTLDVNADTDFEEQLQNFDINPFISGTHTGATGAAELTDSTRDFSTAPGLVGSTVYNKNDNSTCTVSEIKGAGNHTIVCTLIGGTDNRWDAGDMYEGGGNPLELIGVILEALDSLASNIDEIADTDINGALDQKLPVVGMSARDILSQFKTIKNAINDLRTGTSATISCGTTNADPPTGSVSSIPKDSVIACQAVTKREVVNAKWTITGGNNGDNTGIDDPEVTSTVGLDPSANATFTVTGDTPNIVGDDYTVALEYTDSEGLHFAEFPPVAPSSLQKLEQTLEQKLGIPAEALTFELDDLPEPGSTDGAGDGTQDLVIRLGYGICTAGNQELPACAESDRQIPRQEVPLKLNFGEQGLIEVGSDSELFFEFGARAQLDIAIPLPRTFAPNGVRIVETTGIEVEAAAGSDNLNLQASVGPLTVALGTGTIIAQGEHDSSTAGPDLVDSTGDFVNKFVTVGAVLKNTIDGTACYVAEVAADTLTCGAPVDGSDAPAWDQGDDYRIDSVGSAHIGARFSAATAGSVPGSAKETFTIGDFIDGLDASFGGLDGTSCGMTDDDDNPATAPVALDGDVCAKFSMSFDADGEGPGAPAYLGDFDFRIEDISAILDGPDDLDSFEDWYVATPPELLDRIAGELLDWTLLLKALRELTDKLAVELDGAAQSAKVPLIGNALDGGAKVAEKLSDGLAALEQIATMIKGYTIVDGLGEGIQTFVMNSIGPGTAANLLRRADGTPGDPSLSDVVVTMLCDGVECADGTSVNQIDDLRVTVRLGQDLFSEEVPFDIGLDGLPLRAAGAVATNGGWSLAVGFGISRDYGPYLVDNTGNDVGITAAVTLGDPPGDVGCEDDIPTVEGQLDGFSRQRCLEGELGFLRVVLQDGADTTDSGPGSADNDPTAVTFGAAIQLEDNDPSDDRLTFNDFTSGGVEVNPTITAGVNVDLRFKTGFNYSGGDLPNVLGSFHFNWAWALGQDDSIPANQAQIEFKNLNLDAGKFVSKFLEPVTSKIKKVTSPFQPVIDTLRAPIPVVSDLAEMVGEPPVTLYGLMDNPILPNELKMVKSIIAFVSFMNNGFPTDPTGQLILSLNEVQNLGGAFSVDFSKAKSGTTSDKADGLVTNSTKTRKLTDSVPGGKPSPEGAFGVPGLSLPFLDNPSQIFGLLMGKDITLVRYEPGPLRATAGLAITFPPIVIGPIPVSIGISLSGTIEGRFAIGYDTAGLRKVFEGGTADKLIDGIFLDDYDAQGNDVPEVRLIGNVTVSAAVDIGFAAVGVYGGIELIASLNLHEEPVQDGKLRIQEIVANLSNNPMCLFDFEMGLDAFLGAFVRLGYSPFSVEFKLELIRLRLLEFEASLCAPKVPNIAIVQSGGTYDGWLLLKMGPNAGGRNVADNPMEINESFLVRQLETWTDTAANKTFTRFSITAFGVYEEETIETGKGVYADAGDGKDAIQLQPGARQADTNNDGKLEDVPVPFTAPSVLYGGPDNDRIDGGSGKDELHGGDGDDTLLGGDNPDSTDTVDNRDALYGEGNNDVLGGELGDDVLIGGDGIDAASGGAGADWIEGNGDDDLLTGGPGAQSGTGDKARLLDTGDVIIGGLGKDTIDGNQGGDRLSGDDIAFAFDSNHAPDCSATGNASDIDDTVTGGEGNDFLRGGAGGDRLVGSGGNDTICGNAGNDTVDGDDDTIGSGGGGDTLHGGDDNDTMYGRSGVDTMNGDGGDDTMYGGTQGDTMNGGANKDTMHGEAGADTMHGNDGDDTMNGNADADTMHGDADADTMRGGSEADTMHGNAGTDTMFGDSGADDLFGGADNDTMNGNADADDMEGNGGIDTMYGDGGDDNMIGGSSSATAGDEDGETLADTGDTMYGNTGEDVMAGDNASINASTREVALLDDGLVIGTDGIGDTMNGNENRDRMYGGALNDTMHGDAEDDYMEGNGGSDIMHGDADQDDMIGGSSPVANPRPVDAGDTMHGDDAQDVMIGDNGTIIRLEGSDVDDTTLRDVKLLDLASGGDDTMNGNAGNDDMYGGAARDTMHGDAGDDYLEGNHGGDWMYGDGAQDDMIGGTSPAAIDAQTGGNVQDGDDWMSGGDNQDLMAGDNATIGRPVSNNAWEVNAFDGSVRRSVTLYDVGTVGSPANAGTAGGDIMLGDGGSDVMYGQGNSNDTDDDATADGLINEDPVDGLDNDGDSTVDEDPGGDWMSGGDADDDMEGNAGYDVLFGNGGNDDMVGGTGRINDDPETGTNGRLDGGDIMYGGFEFDVMAGDNALLVRTLDGDQKWIKNTFNDGIQHKARVLLDVDSPSAAVVSGPDRMYGDEHDDLMYGQGDNDYMEGNAADDFMEGNAADDTMKGNDGQDDMLGGTVEAAREDGRDTMYGGTNADVMTGDNATIVRPLSAGQWIHDAFAGAALDANDVVRRDITLLDLAVKDQTQPATSDSGGDTMYGDAGRDLMFGQGNGSQAADQVDPDDNVDNDRDGRENGSLPTDILSYDCADGRNNDAAAGCTNRIDEDAAWIGDEMHGGAGHDYMEGNHGNDWMFGDEDEDDLMGGSSAGDGVIKLFVAPATPINLLDGHDIMSGNGDEDVMLGDNGGIRRGGPGAAWQTRSLGSYFFVKRTAVTMNQVALTGNVFGNDFMRGNDGHDDMYGQDGHDYMEGNAGEDAMVGDLGLIADNLLGDGLDNDPAQLNRFIRPNQPFLDDTIDVAGTLKREVTLYAFNTSLAGAVKGDDIMLGGDDGDSMHGGAGDDLMNGNAGDDRLFAGDNAIATGKSNSVVGRDAAWGGPGHDHIWGGYQDDYLDVNPRDVAGFPPDPPAWFTFGTTSKNQDLTDQDYIYGGWHQDAMQANVGDNGPRPGDRLLDWTGAYNVYYLCPGTYGDWVSTRAIDPSLITFLQDLAQGDGAVNTRNSASSGFRETAIVFANEANANAKPPHIDTPGHFYCAP